MMGVVKMKRAWVYIVLCSDQRIYIGSSTNLEQRISDHNSRRYEGYTSKRLPVRLLWSMEFEDIRYAFEFERKIKKWSRAKKEALINGDVNMLHNLSRSTSTKNKIAYLNNEK